MNSYVNPSYMAGVRIADFTWAGAGPFCTKVFSDFGAEVLKIESMTRPDSVRTSGPFKDGIAGINRSGYFASRNTGKKSVSLDLKNPAAREVAIEIIKQSDVVTNNFGPGVMERLGFGYDDIKKFRPDIICLSMPMCGNSGPQASLLGVGMTISAVTGLTWSTAYGPGDVVGPGTHYPDHAANPYHAAFAVIAALRQKRRTGQGMNIELAQVESTANFMGSLLVETAMTGKEPTATGNRSRSQAPHNVYRAKGSDEWVAIAVMADTQWLQLCGVMSRDDLYRDMRLKEARGRVAHGQEVDDAVSAWAAGLSVDEILAQLRAAGVACSKVQSSRDLIENDEQLRASGYFQHVDHPEVGPILLCSLPYKIDGKRVGLRRPPLFGENTHKVLGTMLGKTPAEIADLEQSGALK